MAGPPAPEYAVLCWDVLCLQAVASQRDSDGSEFEPEQLPGMTKPRRLRQQQQVEQQQQQEQDAQVG